MNIEQERPQDASAIRALTQAAFEGVAYSQQTEARIVDALRAAGALTISLVAMVEDRIVGHAAFSPVEINGVAGGWYGLGPVSVSPALQGQGIGQALIGKPEFLVCDEPMSGLDPVGYKEMRDIFIDLKFSGTTLFLNTHILDEVERICDRVGVLHEGVLKDVRDVPEIMESDLPVDYWLDVQSGDASKLSGLPFRGAVSRQEGILIQGKALSQTLSTLTTRKVKVHGIRPLSSQLEAYFLKAIGLDKMVAQAKVTAAPESKKRRAK